MSKTDSQNITRVDILVKKGQEELLTDHIYQFINMGVWLEEQGNAVLIKCYPEEPESFIQQVRVSGLKITGITTTQEKLQDYSELTRRYFRPITIGNLTIRAPWNKKKPINRQIVIEPGMAFGTGRHESTKIMIKIMDSVEFSEKKVLDIGCGSGILSLNAHLLGARRIYAVDNDMDATINAKKNVFLNQANTINVVCANLEDIKGTYDIVLANIDIKTFAEHSERIVALVKEDGLLIISGILRKNRDQLLHLFHDWKLLKSHRIHSWMGFLLSR